MQERKEKLPENSENHIRLKPAIYNPRFYYLRKLRQAVEWAVDTYIKPQNEKQKVRLIDLGCGTKPYISLFQKHNIEYLGADIDWNPHADIYIKNQRVESEDAQFDALVSTQVLEHVDDYQAYLKEANRLLKDHGILLLTTHGYWMYHPDPTDFWRWTSAGLKKIVSEQGFEVVDFQGILGRASMGMQLVQDGILFKIPKFLRPLWALWMQPQIWFFDKLSSQKARNEDACTYIVIARKKPSK